MSDKGDGGDEMRVMREGDEGNEGVEGEEGNEGDRWGKGRPCMNTCSIPALSGRRRVRILFIGGEHTS